MRNERFPTLQLIQDRVSDDVFKLLVQDYGAFQSLIDELDAKRRVHRLEAERALHERSVLDTALSGLLRLGIIENNPNFLQQSLEIIARLVGADVGAIVLRHTRGSEGVSITWVHRHCTDSDQVFLQEELFRDGGVLRRALELNAPVRILPDDAGDRLRHELTRRHVKVGLALPFGSFGSPTDQGALYLEHFTKNDAFSESMGILNDFLAYVTTSLSMMENRKHLNTSLDYSAPYRKLFPYSTLAGRSPFMANLLALLELVRTSQADVSVLLVGEAGVGKRSIARTIHSTSRRSTSPLNIIDCSLPEAELMELLFSDEPTLSRGSNDNPFKSPATMYLHNIHAMTQRCQAALLRRMRDRQSVHLTGIPRSRSQIRWLAGMEPRVSMGEGTSLHAELLERLSTFSIEIPPLRERRDDLLPIAEYFLNEIREQESKPNLAFYASSMQFIENYPWRGNLPQLRRAIYQSVVGQQKAFVKVDGTVVQPADEEHDQLGLRTWNTEHADFRRKLIRRAMLANGGRVSDAAKQLGITRQHLNKRIHELGLDDLRIPSSRSSDDSNDAISDLEAPDY